MIASPLAQLAEITQRKFSPRSFLPLRDSHLWQIETGVVRTLTWLEDGSTIVLGLWGPGDIVGQAFSTIDPLEVECITAVEATALRQDQWEQNTDILVARTRQLEALTVIRSHKRTDAMLIKLLDWLARKFGQDVAAGRLIDFRLTHQDLAELLGTTRVTITRILSQFEQQGMIDRLPLGRIVLKEADCWHYEI